jgi:phospholipid/cholesterol/gamma-HCH transport system substrate-binding protein
MALESRAKWSQLRVGLTAIVAMSILGYLMFLLSGTQGLFKTRVALYTFVDDSAAIAEGAPVRLNGILAGKVKRVRLSGSNQPGRTVQVDMEVDSNFLPQIPVDSETKLAQENLLGTRYINIKKGTSARAVQAGAELKSSSSKELEDVFEQGYSSLAALESILKKMDDVLDAVQTGKGTIGKFLVDDTIYNKANAIVDEAQKMVAALNSTKGTLGKLINDDALYTDVRTSLSRINNLMDGIEQGQGSIGKLVKDPALYDEAKGAIVDTRKGIADLRKLLADIDAGKGTAGKLLKSDELHDQIKGTIARLDVLLDKINTGQGTIGQLVNNPSLYESLDGTTRELQGLLKDFRANPKKFLHIKLGLF